MSNFIVYSSKEIEPKGLNKEQTIDPEKLRSYFFADDFERLSLLDSLAIPFNKKEATLFYPGCGSDIFTPLHYIEQLFPKVTSWKFMFVDTSSIQSIVETMFDDVGIGFERKENTITFYWKEYFIALIFFQQDIFTTMREFQNYDIYFERAFRIMKDQSPIYEQQVYNNLAKSGILISDSGFTQQKLHLINVPQELSTYKEMIIGVKLL